MKITISDINITLDVSLSETDIANIAAQIADKINSDLRPILDHIQSKETQSDDTIMRTRDAAKILTVKAYTLTDMCLTGKVKGAFKRNTSINSPWYATLGAFRNALGPKP